MSSQLSWNIIKPFSSRNRLGLTFQGVEREIQDVVWEFPEMNRVPPARILARIPARIPARILADMVRNGMLQR